MRLLVFGLILTVQKEARKLVLPLDDSVCAPPPITFN